MKTDVTLPHEEETTPESAPKPATKPVHVDFSKKESAKETTPSPFQKAAAVNKRLKLFLWGDSGVGKTTLALQFPKPVVIDMEAGSDLYGESFDFDVLRATTADEVMQAVDWLSTNKHDYRTLVIDPITIYWDALQRKWSDIFLKRNKGSKGYKFEYFDLQPRDWLTLKAELKEFVRKIVSLDMNTIITARQKTQFKEGSFMVAAGETFDGEKSLPYLFDTIVRIYVDEKNRHMGTCLKDRSNKLPKEPFEIKYELFESLFGKESLTRQSKPAQSATAEQKARIAALLPKTGMSDEQITQRLAAYGAETLDDLSAEAADTILKKIETTLSTKTTAQEA